MTLGACVIKRHAMCQTSADTSGNWQVLSEDYRQRYHQSFNRWYHTHVPLCWVWLLGHFFNWVTKLRPLLAFCSNFLNDWSSIFWSVVLVIGLIARWFVVITLTKWRNDGNGKIDGVNYTYHLCKFLPPYEQFKYLLVISNYTEKIFLWYSFKWSMIF